MSTTIHQKHKERGKEEAEKEVAKMTEKEVAKMTEKEIANTKEKDTAKDTNQEKTEEEQEIVKKTTQTQKDRINQNHQQETKK